MPRLYACIGPSHSGKSTYAKKWRSEPSENSRVVVTTDNIRIALAGKRYVKELETVVFAHKHVMLKALLLEGYDVLACGTNCTKESLKRLLEIDPEMVPIVFDVPLEVCPERIKLTGQTDMVNVIKRHRRQLDALLEKGIQNVINEIKQEIEVRWDKG